MRRAHEEQLRAAQDAARHAVQEAEACQADLEQQRVGSLELKWATIMDAAQAQWRQVPNVAESNILVEFAVPAPHNATSIEYMSRKVLHLPYWSC